MKLQGVNVGNNEVKVNASNAVFDSGTHFIIASDGDAKIINEVCTPPASPSLAFSSSKGGPLVLEHLEAAASFYSKLFTWVWYTSTEENYPGWWGVLKT